ITSNSLVTWSASLIWASAWRRACRSAAPRRDRVISFSITGRRSLAFGKVVLICSCLISAAVMLPHIALRWAAVRLNLRPWLPWRMGGTLFQERVVGKKLSIGLRNAWRDLRYSQ